MKTFLVSSLAAALMLPAIAFAADGTITFNGSLRTATCAPATGSATKAVTLPNISTTALNSVGKTAGDTQFEIVLSGCGDTAANFGISIEGANINNAGNIVNTAPNTTANPAAANVTVQVGSRTSGQNLVLPAATPQVASVAGSVTIPLVARYLATGATTVGAVTAPVNFSIVYY